MGEVPQSLVKWREEEGRGVERRKGTRGRGRREEEDGKTMGWREE